MEARIARDRSELYAAFKLLYEIYRRCGYIPPHPSGIRFAPHYGYPTSRTLVLTTAGTWIAGTLTIVRDQGQGLPADLVCGRELRQLRQLHRRVAELTGFCLASSLGAHRCRAFLALTRFAVHYCWWCRLDDLIITVHPLHADFYRRVLGFELLGPVRPHPFVNGYPAVALRLDLRWAHHRVRGPVAQKYLVPRTDVTLFAAPPMSPRDRAFFERLALGRSAGCLHWEPPYKMPMAA
jgi:hypothetical protein